ncbi:boophilin-H2 [Scleropages formosus]|uniref:boophilin-H2 n=1 Tax=Scleropages formosus TaxID=113540 RepID=UPI000878E3B0|nr:boophilin-H2-like [Scleropages formosus]
MRLMLIFGIYFIGVITGTASSVDEAKCNQPVEEGTGDERTIKFYYDAAKSHCVPFFYYGQGGNDNRFDTEVSCMQACSDRHQELYPTGGAVCELPKDQGTCLALFLMFYYNVEEKTCRTFHYSGCGGNGNRFETREECLQTCAKSGRSSGESGAEGNPDEKTVDTGLIVGVVGGCIFVAAVISLIVLLVMQRKSKTKDRKKVPTAVVEVEMQ